MESVNETRSLLVVDLEATCSDDGSVPKHEMEIIEIGAVLVESTGLRPVFEFQSFVRPGLHPRLTGFCTDLTTIRQSDVDDAPLFPEALKAFASWARCSGPVLFASWGDYDRRQLRADCKRHGLRYPFGSGHLNLKTAFAAAHGLKKKPGLADALAIARLKLHGTHHRGIDDARNIARLLPSMRRVFPSGVDG